MAKLKTRDLILDVALVLFNAQGERTVTSVDLAHEMNISPGNLYYHFKGKEEVVEELYARFHACLATIIEQMDVSATSGVGAIVAYLELIEEQIYEFRFIIRDAASLCACYPAIKEPLEKLLAQLHQKIAACVAKLPLPSYLADIENAPQLLADNLLTTVMFSRTPGSLLKAGDERDSIGKHLSLQLRPLLGGA